MNSSQAIALITGAGNGIGRQLALLLAQEGYAIAAIDLREDGLRSLADEMQQMQKQIAWSVVDGATDLRSLADTLQQRQKPFAWKVADVTDAAGLQQAVRELEATLGPTDLLIANAGIGTETSGLSYSAADMNKIINVNLIGVSNSIAAVLPGMIERKRGHLVGISSVASYRGLPRMLGYCASKTAVNAILDGLRVELAPLGIHTTIICPGWIRTAMTDQLDGKLEHLMDAAAAAKEIAYAIRRKLTFYTFPRAMRWKMRLMSMWPRSWQDALIRSMMKRINTKKMGQTPG